MDSKPTSRFLARAAIAAVLACGVSVLLAPASQAVTVGAPLDHAANPGPTPSYNPFFSNSAGCDYILAVGTRAPSCTFLGNDPTGAWTSQIPRGEWVVRLARVNTGPRVGPMVFTVIRATRSQAGAGGIMCCRVPVESQVFTPRPSQTNAIPVNLPMKNTVDVIDGEPIETVDYLGISLLDLNSSAPAYIPPEGTSANTSYIAPAIRAGEERLSDGTLGGNILLVNGEASPAGAGGGAGAPAVSGLDLARSVFRAAGRGPSATAAKRAKVGSKVSYRLSVAAKVTFTVEKRKAGRSVKGKCRKPTRKNRKRKRCNLALKGSFKHQGKAGKNSFNFTGRLRKHKLSPGRYNLVAKPAGSKTKRKRDKFRIVR